MLDGISAYAGTRLLRTELGASFDTAKATERIESLIVRRLNLESRSHALAEQSLDFAVVPSHDMLELNIRKAGFGIVFADRMIWQSSETGPGFELLYVYISKAIHYIRKTI